MSCRIRRQIHRHRRGMTRRADRRRNIQPDTWNLCTSRTHRATFSFSELDQDDRLIIWGYLIVAAQMYAVDVAVVFFASNHIHLICKARIPAAVSLFHCHFKAQVARFIQRKHGLTGAIWGGRFHNQNLLDDEAQVQALTYILDHGMRDLLVERSDAWHLPHTLKELAGDGFLRGKAWRRTVGRRKGEWRQVCQRLMPLDRWADDRTGFQAFVRQRLEDRAAHYAERRAAQQAAHEQAVAAALQAGEDPSTVTVPCGRLRALIRQHAYVPPQAKRSRAVRFKAGGVDAEARLEQARDAHAAACARYDACLAAFNPANPPKLPQGFQWPTALAASLQVPVIAKTWAEVFAASEAVPEGSSWAQAG